MENIKLWRAAIVVRKLFMEEFDTNDFSYLMNEKNPNLSVIPLADAIMREQAIYENTALNIAKSYPFALMDIDKKLESETRPSTISVSVFDDVRFSPLGLNEYLTNNHILDDQPGEIMPLHVYAADFKMKKNLDPDIFYDNSNIEWARDVVLSSNIGYVFDNLQNGLDIKFKAIQSELKFGGDIEIIEIRRGKTKLFEIKISNEKVDLDSIGVVHADLRDVMSLGPSLTKGQLRKIRGNLISDELGV